MTSFSGSVSQVRANWQEGAMYNARQRVHANKVILYDYGMAKNSLPGQYCWNQGVKKRCRLSWLTNSAFVYEPKWGEKGSWLWSLSQ
jgi:hypothetical protein